jgi:hypothetical protein
MELVSIGKSRGKKGKPLNMVPVEVRKEDVTANLSWCGSGAFADSLAEFPYSGSCVENDHRIIAANLDARSIPAISQCRRSRAGEAAVNSPEFDEHSLFRWSTIVTEWSLSQSEKTILLLQR